MEDRCISCGAIIPEGSGWVCPVCNANGGPDMDKTLYNASGYKDPVAHEAINHVSHEERERKREEERDRDADQLIKTLKYIIRNAGFKLCDRIKIEDSKTKKKYL